MNDEQRRVALFQPQPVGPGPFFRLAALSLAPVALLHHARSALPGEKMASGSLIQVVLTGPNSPRECMPGFARSCAEPSSPEFLLYRALYFDSQPGSPWPSPDKRLSVPDKRLPGAIPNMDSRCIPTGYQRGNKRARAQRRRNGNVQFSQGKSAAPQAWLTQAAVQRSQPIAGACRCTTAPVGRRQEALGLVKPRLGPQGCAEKANTAVPGLLR